MYPCCFEYKPHTEVHGVGGWRDVSCLSRVNAIFHLVLLFSMSIVIMDIENKRTKWKIAYENQNNNDNNSNNNNEYLKHFTCSWAQSAVGQGANWNLIPMGVT